MKLKVIRWLVKKLLPGYYLSRKPARKVKDQCSFVPDQERMLRLNDAAQSVRSSFGGVLGCIGRE